MLQIKWSMQSIVARTAMYSIKNTPKKLPSEFFDTIEPKLVIHWNVGLIATAVSVPLVTAPLTVALIAFAPLLISSALAPLAVWGIIL